MTATDAVGVGAPPDQELAGRYKVHAMFFVVKPDARSLLNWTGSGCCL